MWRSFFHVVGNLEYTVEVDGQGRIVLPAEIRRAMGIGSKDKVRVRMRGSELAIAVSREELERRVDGWFKRLSSMSAEPFTEKVEQVPSRWQSDEYARRKLGLS